MLETKPSSPPRLRDIFLAWAGVGVQSFGGGTSTLYLLHRMCTSRGWVSEEEFAQSWALVQISPGINLIKFTVLMGYRLHGVLGILTAVSGFLAPSALITVLMTAGFAVVRGSPDVQAAMRGVMPATVGLGLALGVEMAWPLLKRSYAEGRASLGVHIMLMVGAALSLVMLGASPIAVLLASGVLGLWLLGRVESSTKSERLPGGRRR
ncbi:MAG: chromate transporter [Anaerolineae bacterium]|nr:chromate transporter [Anaerolineae bacterium]